MVQDLFNSARDLEARLNDLERRLNRIAVGSRIRMTNVLGVVPATNSGTGVIGSPLGVTVWKNDSGAERTRGDVVILKFLNTFDLTVIEADPWVIGVVDGSATLDSVNVADQAYGRVRHIGYQSAVAVTGPVDTGDYLITSSATGTAVSAGPSPVEGAFAIATGAVAQGPTDTSAVPAYLFPPLSGTGGGGVVYIPFGSNPAGQVFTP